METATLDAPINMAPPKTNRTPEILAEEWLAAKRAENAAREKRIEIEGEMIAHLGLGEEGSKTHRLNGFKVEIKANVNRKPDWDAFDRVCLQLMQETSEFHVPTKTKRELDEVGLRWYAKNHPGIYARLAQGFTATPGKPGVTVTRTE